MKTYFHGVNELLFLLDIKVILLAIILQLTISLHQSDVTIDISNGEIQMH